MRPMTRSKSAFRLERLALSFSAAGLLALVAPGSASAVSLHVRPDGDDSVCNGLANASDPGGGGPPRACAFRTPQKGVSTAHGGDTVLLHAGVYSDAGATVQGQTNILGIEIRSEFFSEATRLVIRDAGDGTVTFEGNGTLDTGISIWGTSYITVEGIEFQGFTADNSGGFSYGAAAVNVGSPGVGSPSNRIVLKSLVVRGATLAHNVGAFAEIAFWCSSCAYNIIDSCRIESVEPAAIALGTPTISALTQLATVSHNTIVHVRDFQSWTGLLADRSDGGTAEGNYFAESATKDTLTDELRLANSSNWRIANNIFYRAPRSGVHLLDDDTDGTNIENHVVVNNTFECTQTAGSGIRIRKCTNCEIRNNIIAGCHSGVRIVDDNQGSTAGFNDLFLNTVNYDPIEFGFNLSVVGGDVTSDPLFRATLPRPDPFYRLDVGSPAIDTGDLARCGQLPDDGMCDMGAFEVLGTTGNRRPVQPSIDAVDRLTGKSVRLHSSPFSDPDAGNIHAASQWQVDFAAGDFSTPVKDTDRTTSRLTAFDVSGLAATTTYKSRVRHQDNEGAWSAWSDPSIDTNDEFTTLVATAIPPRVILANPLAGARGVLANVHPVLTFDVPLDPASVTSATVQLVVGRVAIAQAVGSPTLDGTGTIVTITPAGLLQPDLSYKVLVVGGDAGVHSRDGSIAGVRFGSRFTVEGPLVSSNPAHLATGVSTAIAPQLVFKWAVDPSTATTLSVTIKDLSRGGLVVPASITVAGATVTFTPASPLSSGHRFQLTVLAGTNGLKFTDGRMLRKPLKIQFRTG